MGGDGAPGRHDGIAVLLDELPAHIRVQLLVQRPQLRPQPVDDVLEVIRLVVAPPEVAGVFEA